jgi:putative SOS response-associated peptidase YedK
MSRLHAIAATAAEVATHFGAELGQGVGVPLETTEGSPGLVVFEGGGRRLLRTMTWGFPRFTRAMHTRGEAPGRVGMVAHLTNPMWEDTVVEPKYRCLIPLTHFANPDGDAGAKTRTWFSVRDQPIVAWARFCRNIPDHGPVYAGMTMEANEAIPPTNDRMPVILDPGEYELWLHGSIQDVIRFQYRDPIEASRMVVERTEDRWRSGKGPPRPDVQAAQLALM